MRDFNLPAHPHPICCCDGSDEDRRNNARNYSLHHGFLAYPPSKTRANLIVSVSGCPEILLGETFLPGPSAQHAS